MINSKQLARDWKANPAACQQDLSEALQLNLDGEPGGFGLEDVSFKDFAEELLGYQFFSDFFDPRRQLSKRMLREAEEAVDSTGFSNITGQLIVNRVMQAFQNEEFVASRLVSTIPTRLNGEKIPGIGKISDPTGDNVDNLTVNEGMPYPRAGVAEDYIETPATTKRGLIVPITREAIFFDRTGVIAQRCGEVGEVLGLSKEKRLLDAIAGLVNLYKWKGTTYQTYYQGIDSANWENHLDGTGLVDWTDIDAAELLFANMLDPNTSEPIVMGGNMTLFVPWQLRSTAMRIVSATSIDTRTASSTIVTYGANPLTGLGITVAASRQLYRRMVNGGVSETNAAATWFYGNLAKAFAYMENWPITVTQSGMDSEAAFEQDIVLRFKASERGAAAVMEPRAIVRARAVSTSSSSGA